MGGIGVASDGPLFSFPWGTHLLVPLWEIVAPAFAQQDFPVAQNLAPEDLAGWSSFLVLALVG